MTAQTSYNRPGTQRTDHLSHQRATASRSGCSSCPHSPTPGEIPLSEQNNRLSHQMWQICADIEAQASNLDSALRRTWLCLGGILLPLAGVIVYAMAHVR